MCVYVIVCGRTVSTETSLPPSAKSSFRSLAVSLGFLSTCLLRNLAAMVEFTSKHVHVAFDLSLFMY